MFEIGQVVTVEKFAPKRVDDPFATFPQLGVMPLRYHEQAIGALVVACHLDGWNDADRALLQVIGDLVAPGIHMAKLYRKERRRTRDLRLVNEISRLVMSALDRDEMIRVACNEILEVLNVSLVAIVLLDATGTRVVHGGHATQLPIVDGVDFKKLSLKLGDGVVSEVISTERNLRLGDVTQHRRYKEIVRGIRSELCVPLRIHGKTIGVIAIEDIAYDRFDEHDEALLENIAGYLAQAIDNARLQEAKKKTEQLRDDLSRMVVHDLRNPVQAVQLTLQAVSSFEALTPLLSQEVEQGKQTIQDILEMIGSLLDIARFEAGKIRLKRAPTSLNDHLHAVIHKLSPLIRAKSISLVEELSGELPPFWLDHDLIQRTFVNVIGNALKFTPECSSVRVQSCYVTGEFRGVRLATPMALISIEDSGDGIAREYHEKIFEKFGQVESHNAGNAMSTGLGLAFCKFVVEAHGGRIWVESEPHHGATFFIALPNLREGSPVS